MPTKWFVSVAILALVLLIAYDSTCQAQEDDFPMWPFDDSGAASPEYAQAGDDVPWTLGSRLSKLRWRHEKMIGDGQGAPQSAAGRSYVLGQNHPSALQVIANTPRRMAGRVRSLWDRSVDMLSFGTRESLPAARQSPPRRSWFGRWFGGQDDAPEGPQTISEWMEQDRLGP